MAITELTDAWAQYDENANYLSDPTLAKAYLFAEACRWLIAPHHTAERSSHDGEELEFDLRRLDKELDRVEDFIRKGGALAPKEVIIFHDYEGYRGESPTARQVNRHA